MKKEWGKDVSEKIKHYEDLFRAEVEKAISNKDILKNDLLNTFEQEWNKIFGSKDISEITQEKIDNLWVVIFGKLDQIGYEIEEVPEPNAQRQLGAVHEGACSHRGLAVATGAFEGPGLGLELPSLGMAADRADETLWPARCCKVSGTGSIVGKEALELNQRARKIRHGSLQRSDCSLFVLPCSATLVTRSCRAGP